MDESERAQLAAAAPARAAQLIADFMTRHDTWRKEAHDLARHRGEVRAAAEREAADLLARARAEIRRTLVDTRRELQVLATQLRAVDESLQIETPTSAPTASWKTASDSVARVRRDLQQVLGEAQPDLEELAMLASFLGNGARTQETDNNSDFRVQSSDSAVQTSDSELQTSDFSKSRFPYIGPEKAPALAAESPFQNSTTPQRPAVTYGEKIKGLGHGKRVVIVLAALGATAVPIAGWRVMVSTEGSTRRPAPVAVAPELKPTPAVSASKLPPVPATPASVPSTEQSMVPASTSSDRQTWLWLVVEARRSAWIQATIDGQTDQGRVLRAGETRRILAKSNISIVVGDAGAVTLSLNGGQPTTLGRDGQVVTRRFTSDDAERIIASQTRSGPYRAVPTTGADAANGRLNPPVSDDARSEILTLSQRWLDGYYRRDNNTMAYVAVPDASIVDERQINQRLTYGLTQVDRALDQMQFDQRGDTAVLTARMTERADIRGYTTQVVSRVSERWRRQANRWRLDGIRIAGEAR